MHFISFWFGFCFGFVLLYFVMCLLQSSQMDREPQIQYAIAMEHNAFRFQLTNARMLFEQMINRQMHAYTHGRLRTSMRENILTS